MDFLPFSIHICTQFHSTPFFQLLLTSMLAASTLVGGFNYGQHLNGIVAPKDGTQGQQVCSLDGFYFSNIDNVFWLEDMFWLSLQMDISEHTCVWKLSRSGKSFAEHGGGKDNGLDPHGQFCVDISEYGPISYKDQEKKCCQTTTRKECRPVKSDPVSKL